MRMLVAALLWLAFAAAPAHAERLALIIGNDAYEYLEPLQKARNDARDLATFLRAQGFAIYGGERDGLDLDQNATARLVSRFVRDIAAGDEVFVFFAGHGVAVGGDNYLLPVDIDRVGPDDETYVSEAGLSLNALLTRLDQTRAQVRVVVIDACRENPFASEGGRSVGGGRGMRGVEPPEGTLVLYSAGAGQIALDRLSDSDRARNSVFMRTFLPLLRQDGASIRSVAYGVRGGVEDLARERRNHRQRPALYDNLRRSDEYCIIGPCDAGDASAPPPVDEDLAAWEEAGAAGTRTAFQDYLEAFPDGRFRVSAERLLAALVAPASEEEAEAPDPAPVSSGSRAPGSRFRDTLRSGGEGPQMVVLPAGSFTMGSPANEAGRASNEGPQRTVTIPHAFAVGLYEVTWDEWETCVRGGGCNESGPQGAGGDEGYGRGRRPVGNVDWNDAQAYARWLSSQSGQRYRLLTEAEWEYAARAGTTGRFSWGSQDPACSSSAPNGANFIACSGDRTHVVGSYRANGFGLHDMHGNVWEWVQDCYVNSYAGAPTNGAAVTSGSCTSRVFRGGSWNYIPRNLRSAYRVGITPTYRGDRLGFRLARML